MASTTRQALLQALSAAEGTYISGQQLAQQLGVSRAAVHKAAAALTAQGYALEAASRRGYRLLGGDPFCAEAVGPYPAPVQLYDTLESTNRTAKLLALEGAAHGTLVLAGGQTAGRGRLGRSFASPAGKGVYCSVVLRPPLPAANAQTATIGAAVAVCRAELTAKAGGLYPGGPAPVSRAPLAGASGRELLALCPGFECLDEYRARCFVPGHWVTVCTGTETYAAQALSIDGTGRLVVQREGGRIEALRCGEVTIRPIKTD